ncbi:MAG: hypothetical protein ACTSUO_00985 [Candidatus Thorarchaeota archaeon]
MEKVASALEFGKNWRDMLNKLAEAESLVDVYLCSNAYGNQDDREKMVSETHGVRIIFVGEDFFIVGPRRPVPASIIPTGWISMIRIRDNEDGEIMPELIGSEDKIESDVNEQPA